MIIRLGLTDYISPLEVLFNFKTVEPKGYLRDKEMPFAPRTKRKMRSELVKTF